MITYAACDGGITVGRFADRFGILPPFACGTILMCVGYIAASFGPLVADAALWFDRHRGLAISLAAPFPVWSGR